MVENEVTQIMGSGFLSTAHYSNYHRTILTKKIIQIFVAFLSKIHQYYYYQYGFCELHDGSWGKLEANF